MITNNLGRSANLRDLGGLPTADARRVRGGKLFRSAMLDIGDAAVLDDLRSLGITTIVDLRSDGERNRFPTPWEAIGCADYWFHKHVSEKGNLALLLAENSTGTADQVRHEMFSLYRNMPHTHARSYRALFDKLVEGQTPLLFHCMAGKDRTGVAAALVLSALSVSRETILREYMLTEAFDLWAAPWMQTQFAKGFAIARAPQHLVQPVLATDPSYLQSFFDEVDGRYGSVEAYLRDVLMLEDGQLRQLRENLLETAG